MRSDITSIPVEEVFEPRDGCPLCRLRDLLDSRIVEYITGAAMMEPDIRIETNKLGFCLPHYQMMLKKSRRLSVSLILESHLAEIEKQALSRQSPSSRQMKKSASGKTSCFVCEQVDITMEKMVDTVCRQWERDWDFRALFAEQKAFCLPHLTYMAERAPSAMNKKYVSDFIAVATDICRRSLQEIREDVSHFNKMFDYRNSGEGADWGNSKDSAERAVWWLTSRDPR